MERTLLALRKAFADAKAQGADQVLAAGTMALRIARNREEFLSMAEGQGTPAQVLSGEEEARLGLLSVTLDPLFSSEERLSIVDVGGHSTEIAIAKRTSGGAGVWEQLFRKSFEIGTLGLIGGTLKAECPSGIDLVRAAAEIDNAIAMKFGSGEAGLVAALGATGTNLVSIRERLVQWDPDRVHGQRLSYEEISRAVSFLSQMPLAERSKLIGMEPGRENTLHAGALILERSLHALGRESCKVSVRGWRHALLETTFHEGIATEGLES